MSGVDHKAQCFRLPVVVFANDRTAEQNPHYHTSSVDSLSVFMPQPPIDVAEACFLSGCPSVRAYVRACVLPVHPGLRPVSAITKFYQTGR